jgi:hypothetical protein
MSRRTASCQETSHRGLAPILHTAPFLALLVSILCSMTARGSCILRERADHPAGASLRYRASALISRRSSHQCHPQALPVDPGQYLTRSRKRRGFVRGRWTAVPRIRHHPKSSYGRRCDLCVSFQTVPVKLDPHDEFTPPVRKFGWPSPAWGAVPEPRW